MKHYDPKKIEKRWQKKWEEVGVFKTPYKVTKANKFYILPQYPYPSGSGLHVGHAEVYTGCDIYARYQRMQGKKVLQIFGLDSFGLPAENYAIKTNVHPKKTIDQTGEMFVSQVKSLGISVDWDRFIRTSDPEYYKWTQWFFLLMYKRGLAYRKMQSVNWCDSCKTVLANEQVVNKLRTSNSKLRTEIAVCERCENQVVQKKMEQWFLRITEYADRLAEDLDKVDWPKETKMRQRNWIGRSNGAIVRFAIEDIRNTKDTKLRNTVDCFTTRPDTLFGATYLVLSPEHEKVIHLKSRIKNWEEVDKYIKKTAKLTEMDRQTQKEKTGIELKGIKAINPANCEEIPVWIADYVLATYGTGSIMAVPAHDQRDFEFASKFKLPIKMVVCPNYPEPKCPILKNAFVGEGHTVDSGFLDGLKTAEAKEKMIKWLENEDYGKRKVTYRLRDWSVSRQRFWGAPLPMLRNEKGELKNIPEEDLPVILPDDVDFKPTGESPLNYSKDFQKGVEEKYGNGWQREPDTLDTFMCSSWYYFRYLDPKNDKEFASPEQLKKWMPVDFYLGGEEHVNGHLLYSRFFTKVLFDAGYIDFDEPFLKHRHQGTILGEDNKKMSKRWNNVINPTDVVNEYGADTVRMYEMFMGPLEDTKPWSTDGVKGVRRFVERVWRLQDKVVSKFQSPKSEVDALVHKTIKKVGDDASELKFNTAIAKLMELSNAFMKEKEISRDHFEIFIKLLSPFAPHICEEMWYELGNKSLIATESWPKYSKAKLVDDSITIVVQINGKVRASLELPSDISEDKAKKMALEEEKVIKRLEGKEPRKIIFVKGRLVSIVV
jgi:leucyl-tRNA synthetase